MDEPISTPGQSTAVQARIRIRLVAVVALLDARMYESISTGCKLTDACACIRITGVAVVACFAGLNNSVAATGVGFALHHGHDDVRERRYFIQVEIGGFT